VGEKHRRVSDWLTVLWCESFRHVIGCDGLSVRRATPGKLLASVLARYSNSYIWLNLFYAADFFPVNSCYARNPYLQSSSRQQLSRIHQSLVAALSTTTYNVLSAKLLLSDKRSLHVQITINHLFFIHNNPSCHLASLGERAHLSFEGACDTLSQCPATSLPVLFFGFSFRSLSSVTAVSSEESDLVALAVHCRAAD